MSSSVRRGRGNSLSLPIGISEAPDEYGFRMCRPARLSVDSSAWEERAAETQMALRRLHSD
jgi:hypothetical protein